MKRTEKWRDTEKHMSLEETKVDNLSAELDEEVEKELREFEQLQNSLPSSPGEQENKTTGGTNNVIVQEKEQPNPRMRKECNKLGRQNVEEEHKSGSDMEFDNLEEEIKDDHKSGGLIDESRITEHRDRACLDLASEQSQFELLPTVPLSDIIETLIAKYQNSPTDNSEDDSNDPDFPTPGNQKSRSGTKRYKKRRLEEFESSPKKLRADNETVKSQTDGLPIKALTRTSAHSSLNQLGKTHPVAFEGPTQVFANQTLPTCNKKLEFEDAVFNHGLNPMDKAFRGILPPLDGPCDRVIRAETSGDREATVCRHYANDFDLTSYKSKYIKEVAPHIPVCCTERLKQPNVQPKPLGREPHNNKSSENAGLSIVGSQNLSNDTALTRKDMDLTTDFRSEYCFVEQIIQRRYMNYLLLDSDKLDLLEANRPEIWCPELYPFLALYENQTWLAACNELKRFFCRVCLLFAGKAIWSIAVVDREEMAIKKEINKHTLLLGHQDSIKQRNALLNKSSIVQELLSNNFLDGTWTEGNRENIIIKGRPRPILKTNQKPKVGQTLACQELYSKVKWMTGNSCTDKFHCWPCLLFSNEKWEYMGYIESTEASVSSHERSRHHMDACLKLGKWEFDLQKKSLACKVATEQTRNFLKYLVEILVAEKKKIDGAEISPLDLVDSLELLCRYNSTLKMFMDDKSKNPDSLFAQIQLFTTAIVDSVELLIKRSILEEVKNSNFVCLIIDHSSGSSNKAILSVIARYVDRTGHLQERFVKLLNVGYNTPSNTLVEEIIQVIIELQCQSSLIGFTFDGYLVKPGNILEFNAKIQKLCPNAQFFHYAEHTFKRVLKQTLCQVPICRSVLQAVEQLAEFFESSPIARKSLLEIVGKDQGEDFWRLSNFITTLCTYYDGILDIVESILKNSQDWRLGTVVEATNFHDFLTNSTKRLYVTLMTQIFRAANELDEKFDEDDIEKRKTIAHKTGLKLKKLGQNFDTVVDSACSHLEASQQETLRKEMLEHREECSKVVHFVVDLVKNRVFALDLAYISISEERNSSTGFVLPLKRQVLRATALPPFFDTTKLSSELKFIRNSPNFQDLDLPDIIDLMNDYNLLDVLPELFKFLQLALTVPQKHTKRISALYRISAFVERKKYINSTDALMWMEKDLLSNLQKGSTFYDEVIDRVISFTEKEKTP